MIGLLQPEISVSVSSQDQLSRYAVAQRPSYSHLADLAEWGFRVCHLGEKLSQDV